MLKNNRTKAFTLIELLISIAIIAILTAIVTSNLTTSKSKARDAKRISDLAQLQLVMETFFDRCGRYPIVENNMPKLSDSGGGCPSGIEFSDYITKIPTDPRTDYSYLYGVNNSTTPTDYVIKAMLENNNSVLQDIERTNHTGYTPSVDCTNSLSYCLRPR